MPSVAATDQNRLDLSLEGRVLGTFRLVREIAVGGMATVYLAQRNDASGQAAAVKVIHPHLARDSDFVNMFLDESRLVSSIQHPNVCRVLEYGRAEGTYYLAMEYVMGENWNEVLAVMKQHPEARHAIPSLLGQVMLQACEGLHAAHEARDPQDRALGIVHRDVSPQNLIVGYDGSVRVIDFGIASAAERLHVTRNGAVKGRFAYMAPEQMRGLPVDRRADVWSLGVVLWEALAQRRLFKRETEAETVFAVTHETLPAAEWPGGSVPEGLARVVRGALEREREARYGSARELGLELSRLPSSQFAPAAMEDLSHWMQLLFAERIAIKRLVQREAARAAEAERTPEGAATPEEDPGISGARFKSVSKGALGRTSEEQTAPSMSSVRAIAQEEADANERAAEPLSGPTPERPAPAARFARAPEDALRQGRALTWSLLGLALVLGALSYAVAAREAAVVHSSLDAVPRLPVPAMPSPPPPQAPTTLEQAAPAPVVPAQAAPVVEAGDSAREPNYEAPALPLPKGRVQLLTPGTSATVFLADQQLGVTPLKLWLPVGKHVVRIWPRGDRQREVERTIEVKRTPSRIRFRF